MLYKRTTTKYTRNTPNCKWKVVEVTTDYCGEHWANKMTGPDEIRFFNNLHWARGGRVGYSNDRYFTSISPTRIEKFYDRFEPVRIPWTSVGNREYEALCYASAHMKCIQSTVENGHELLVIPYKTEDGDDRTVTYDLTHKVFVG